MESIQLAQMLADLSDLNAAQDPQASVGLVTANKTLNQPTPTTPATPSELNQPHDHPLRPSIRPGQRHHTRTGSAGSIGSGTSSFISRTASPAKFDKYGRRILTPPNTRANSTYGSIPGTPKSMTGTEMSNNEDDVDRAGSLMALYEIRAKLKDQDNRGLLKLREKISALQAQRAVQDGGKEGSSEVGVGGGRGGRSRYTFPKSS
ncbi:hypothetical protein QBC38DRAFT_450993 [Podospora fimiseda]|uniref:Uncharacterized protein n=1 Tax=Podospora fimiseda TaxID=252190 RepID=A0AAN7H877_9PEZI|nr:hypothetical protein QBC38DRAFT_450993 [Podospora fimiseda]